MGRLCYKFQKTAQSLRNPKGVGNQYVSHYHLVTCPIIQKDGYGTFVKFPLEFKPTRSMSLRA